MWAMFGLNLYNIGGLLFLLGAATFQSYRYYQSLGQALLTDPLSFYPAPFEPILDPSKRAYATCLYNEAYLPGALLLGWSLQEHGMLAPEVAEHMVLLHTPGALGNGSLRLLEEAGWEMREVKLIPPPEGRPPASNFGEQYTKLRLFELEDYQQIFYLDADTLAVAPFPSIWSFPAPLAAARDVRKGSGWLPSINAGTLLLKPNKPLVQHMLSIAPRLKYDYTFAEQGLLQAFWAQAVTHLPYVYNGQLGIRRVFPRLWEEVVRKDVKVLHYTGLKPWEWHEPPDMPEERALWWETWERMVRQRKERGLSDLGRLGRKPE